MNKEAAINRLIDAKSMVALANEVLAELTAQRIDLAAKEYVARRTLEEAQRHLEDVQWCVDNDAFQHGKYAFSVQLVSGRWVRLRRRSGSRYGATFMAVQVDRKTGLERGARRAKDGTPPVPVVPPDVLEAEVLAFLARTPGGGGQ